MTSMACLTGLDWGTSSLRAYLFGDGGRVLDTRQRPWGLRHLPDGGFEAALGSVCTDWPDTPLIASGMVGSRGGWHEAPYVDLPGGLRELAAALVRVPRGDARALHIVPGLRHGAGPDVMRGEETQIVGALDISPALSGQAMLIMPGTHSKWVHLRAGRVVDFMTCMTGELFALLRTHSILGGEAKDAPDDDPDAFMRGVQTARDSGCAGGLSRLFSARALMLDGRLAPDAVPAYLSGLLIGEELRAARAAGRLDTRIPTALIGDAQLCARYRAAGDCFGLDLPRPVEHAAARGLWRLGEAAGLAAAAGMDAPPHDRGTPA